MPSWEKDEKPSDDSPRHEGPALTKLPSGNFVGGPESRALMLGGRMDSENNAFREMYDFKQAMENIQKAARGEDF